MNFPVELIYYIIIANIISFIIMYIDKRRAIKGIYRISEKILFSFAMLGGSLGIIMGMYKFKHKTKKYKFKYGLPIIIIIQIILILFLTNRLII
ncbi:DUF1294 domain-containing protein [Alkalibaculum sp. M08DMB]|uniref:DUF1294 domain-containing protein n=1 Tax=Alkalibaculum sporogenes TaxID=2655001 RepID=A0A6A7K9S3_9FIRM|nr:DUF1294 domain-containing protein [Alkalibaculum sporogenes]MPW25937.1 DUF1294 domain-containing protein [Alkalibaculum sporogenes]